MWNRRSCRSTATGRGPRCAASRASSEGGTIDQLTSTYRLQFTPEFTFADALEIVPYLASLGISHIYASPIFAARPGSRHGYDVINPNEINPELGGREGFDALIQAAHQHG
ncbi:MAG: alpha-amylase family glycosyl hydrolase, partial [Spirochaetales bacterium]